MQQLQPYRAGIATKILFVAFTIIRFMVIVLATNRLQ